MLDQHLLEDLDITISSEAYEILDPDLQRTLPIVLRFLKDIKDCITPDYSFNVSCYVDEYTRSILIVLTYSTFIYCFSYHTESKVWEVYTTVFQGSCHSEMARTFIEGKEKDQEKFLEDLIQKHYDLTKITKDYIVYTT